MDQTKSETPAGMVGCAHPGCAARIKNHYWGKVKSNWFQQKDGKSFCPEHTPAWVAAWRAKKAQA